MRDKKSCDGFTSTAKRERADIIAVEPNISHYYALKDLHLIHTKIGRYDNMAKLEGRYATDAWNIPELVAKSSF